MAEYDADKALPIPIRLVYCNRSEDEIVYRHELEALETQDPRFGVFHTLTRTAERGWEGRTGRIDQALPREAAKGLADPTTTSAARRAWSSGRRGYFGP